MSAENAPPISELLSASLHYSNRVKKFATELRRIARLDGVSTDWLFAGGAPFLIISEAGNNFTSLEEVPEGLLSLLQETGLQYLENPGFEDHSSIQMSCQMAKDVSLEDVAWVRAQDRWFDSSLTGEDDYPLIFVTLSNGKALVLGGNGIVLMADNVERLSKLSERIYSGNLTFPNALVFADSLKTA